MCPLLEEPQNCNASIVYNRVKHHAFVKLKVYLLLWTQVWNKLCYKMWFFWLYFNRNFVNINGNAQHKLRELVGGMQGKQLHPNT